MIEKKPNGKNLSKKEKSKFVINSLLKILKNSKLNLKAANIPKSQNVKILKFILKNSNKINSNKPMVVSNNPIQLNKEDLTIIIKKILN